MPQRHIPLDGQPNFRDIGGYTANDGRQVRWGTVYRSGELNKLSDRDLDRLAELGIRTVVDLRSEAEIAYDAVQAADVEAERAEDAAYYDPARICRAREAADDAREQWAARYPEAAQAMREREQRERDERKSEIENTSEYRAAAEWRD